MTVELELLTREELDAILAEMADGQAAPAGASRLAAPFRRDRTQERAERPDPAPELRRAVASFAESWGSQLANRYQRRVRCALIGWEEVDTFVFAQSLLASDRPTLFGTDPGAPAGFALVSRPLGFALLSLSFGGRRGSTTTIPERPYTRIELRFLGHLAGQLVGELQRMAEAQRGAFSAPTLPALQLRETVTPEDLVERAASKVVLASLDVTGQDLEGRVRLAFPRSWVQAPASRETGARPARDPGLEAAVVDLPVRVCAEVGHAELGLRRLGSLAPGDVVELRRSVSDGLLVRVGGRPKFRAVRGNVGGRLAVQVVDRIGGGGSAS